MFSTSSACSALITSSSQTVVQWQWLKIQLHLNVYTAGEAVIQDIQVWMKLTIGSYVGMYTQHISTWHFLDALMQWESDQDGFACSGPGSRSKLLKTD